MDLSTLSASETAVIKLLHPATGEPLTDNGEPLTVSVYGPGTVQHQQMRSARDRRIMAAAMAANKAGKKPADIADPDKERADTAADLAACTASIGGWDYKGATDAAAIKSAYADASMSWLADQVSRGLGDWATFLPQPAND